MRRIGFAWMAVLCFSGVGCNEQIPPSLPGHWYLRPSGAYTSFDFRIDGRGVGHFQAEKPQVCAVPPCPSLRESGTFTWRNNTIHLSPNNGPRVSFQAQFTPRGIELRSGGRLMGTLMSRSEAQEQAEVVPEPAPGTPCSGLTRRQCQRTPACVLVVNRSREPGQPMYVCRPPENACEGHAAQTHPSFGSVCTSHAGCWFFRGGGYCHCRGYGATLVADPNEPGCACATSGGPVAMCIPSGTTP